MKQKRGVLIRGILVAAALSFGLAGGAWATQSIKCGSNVSQQGKIITVKPKGGGDDTASLQCALDLAVAGGRGSVVQLTQGKFYTAQLVAKNLKGTIRGVGMKHTIIRNLSKLYVTPDNAIWVGLPSADNPWPSLLSFINGDFAVRNLAIEIVGVEPTQGWILSDAGLTDPIKALAHAIVIVGERADVRVSGVSVSGQPSPDDPLYGFNLYNGIYFEGLGPRPTPPLAGSYEVRDSRFQNIATATDVAHLKDAKVVFENNVYDYRGAYSTVEIADVTNTDVRIVGNYISSSVSQIGISGINITAYGLQPNGFTDSRLFVAHNTIKGTGTAISIDGALKFSGKTSCHVILNDTTRVTKLPAIVLGPGTKNCLVVTREANTVNDEGKNNRIITVPRR